MGTNVDIAATDIREALNRIRADLPDGADEPTIRKIDTNATTVVQAFLVGDRTQDDLYDYADDVIADRFSSVPGVGEVRVYGANEMQIHVLLKREKLTAMNLSISDVVDKLKENNIREPLGRIQFDKGEKNVTFDGDFKDFEQIKALEIGKFKDKRIYLPGCRRCEVHEPGGAQQGIRERRTRGTVPYRQERRSERNRGHQRNPRPLQRNDQKRRTADRNETGLVHRFRRIHSGVRR